MSLDKIVNVTITKGTKTVSQVGFGVPMILGTHTRFAEKIRFYSSMTGVAADFLTSDAEYVAASAMFGQEKKPALIAIGKRTATPAAQVITFTPTPADNTTYTVNINGIPYTFVSGAGATAAQVVTALIALVNAGSQAPYVLASGTTTLIITSKFAGLSFSYSSTPNLAGVVTTANAGVQSDLNDILAVNGGNDWYMLVLTSKAKNDILQAAAWTESQFKMFLASSSDSDVLTNGTGNVAAQIHARAYSRTAYLWSNDPGYAAAAWAGRVLPDDPGSETWKFKTLIGILPDFFNDTQVANLETNAANYFETDGGLNITFNGTVADGEFIDSIRFIDWVTARVKENIFSKLVNVEKIPYTNNGINVIVSAVDEIMKRGLRAGGIADTPAYLVTAPDVLDISATDRGNRLLPDVNFSFRLAGAIHKVIVKGTVSV